MFGGPAATCRSHGGTPRGAGGPGPELPPRDVPGVTGAEAGGEAGARPGPWLDVGGRDTGSRPRTRRPSGPLGAPPQRPRLAAGPAARLGCGEDPAGSGGCSSEVLLLVSCGWALLAAQARAPGGSQGSAPHPPHSRLPPGPRGRSVRRELTAGVLPPDVRGPGSDHRCVAGCPKEGLWARQERALRRQTQPGGPGPLVPRRLPSPG